MITVKDLNEIAFNYLHGTPVLISLPNLDTTLIADSFKYDEETETIIIVAGKVQ